MRSILLASAILLALSKPSLAQNQEEQPPEYLGQKPPGMTPQVFAPGIISLPDRSEFGSVFSANGREFFYGVDADRRAEIHYTRQEGDFWSEPRPLISHQVYSHNDPFLTPDEQALFFISDRPLSGSGEKKDYDLWYATRTPDGWSEPINAGPAINTTANEYYISFSRDTVMYFSSNAQAPGDRPYDYDIYAAQRTQAGFQTPARLGEAINSGSYEADVFVAYDESYLIFCGDRSEGYGKGDLLISFRQADGNWTPARNMGTTINTEGHELCPFVTRDGRYFFYTSRQDLYWVDAQLIEELRQQALPAAKNK